MNIDRIGGAVIADANNIIIEKIKQHRPSGIDLRLVLGKGESNPGVVVIRRLVVAFRDCVTSGLVEESPS